LAQIQKMATRASRVRIQAAADPEEAVQSMPRSYPVLNIQRGECIGCGRALPLLEVADNWVCWSERSAVMLDTLWHEHVPRSPETKLDRCVYTADGNARGLQWKAVPPSATSWMTGPDSQTPGLPCGLEIFVDAVESSATHVQVMSAGIEEGGERVEFLLNNARIPMATGRGINVVTINVETEKVNNFWYDTTGQQRQVANDQLTTCLNEIQPGVLVLIAVQGTGLEALEPKSVRALRRCGATLEGNIAEGQGGQGYALVSCKGGFALAESIGSRAVAAGYVEGLGHLADQVARGTWTKNEPQSATDTRRGNKIPALYKGGGTLHHV
jgi:hypothetical protein